MRTGFLRTVLGDIPAGDAGVCYAHEHVFIGPSFATFRYPELRLDDVDRIVCEVLQFRRDGGRTMVDSMPCGGGRDVLRLAEISHRTEVHIVCPTGLHLKKYYAPGHWRERYDAEILAAVFVDEIEKGIDANDTNGPAPVRTAHRAGVIKVATGGDTIGSEERLVFEGAAIAHQETGCPILTHTEKGAAALDQAALLKSLGVPAGKIVISHTDRRPDLAYHREILATGVFLEYDAAFRWKCDQGNPTRDLILTLCREGYGSQIVVGMDAAKPAYWKSYEGSPGLSFLLRVFFPDMRARGLAEEDAERILIDNPARAYAFEK